MSVEPSWSVGPRQPVTKHFVQQCRCHPRGFSWEVGILARSLPSPDSGVSSQSCAPTCTSRIFQSTGQSSTRVAGPPLVVSGGLHAHCRGADVGQTGCSAAASAPQKTPETHRTCGGLPLPSCRAERRPRGAGPSCPWTQCDVTVPLTAGSLSPTTKHFHCFLYYPRPVTP